ncbi:MAG TPA: GAF domain-containing protein [Acidimicrobiales bacterium]|nr:GAF domain-containing protein [Acidimicrobiales bacterium]
MAGARRRTLTLRYRGVTLLLLGAAWMALAEVMFRVVTNPRLHKPALEVAGGWGVVALAGLGVLAIILTMLAGADQAKAAERALADNLRSIELVTEASLALLPLEELLDALLSRLMGALRAEVAVIFLVSEDGRKLVVRACRGLPAELEGTELAPGDSTVAGRVAATGQAVISADLARVFSPLVRDRAAILAAVPLRVAGRTTGVVQVGLGPGRRFEPADVTLLELVADRAAASIERARLDAAERRARLGAEAAREHLGLLAQAGQLLGGALDDYKSVTEELGRLVVPAFADWFAADFTDDSGGVVIQVREGATSTGGYRRRYRSWDDLMRPTLTEGKPVLLYLGGAGNPETGRELLEAAGFQSLMIVPVRVRGLSFGTLRFATRHQRRGYRPSDLETAQALAHRVAATVERVLLYRETQLAARAATERASRLRRLMEASMALNGLWSEQEILGVVAGQSRRVLGVDRAVVTVHSDGDWERIEDSDGLAPLAGAELERLEMLCAMTEHSNRSMRGGGSEDPGGGSWYWLAVPMTYLDGRRLGSIVMIQTEEAFGPEDESVAVSLAQVAAAAIGNSRLYHAVETNGQRLQTLVESAPLAIIEFDLEGRARWHNPAARTMLGGLDLDVLRGSPVSGLVQLPDALKEAFARAGDGHASTGLELAAVRQNGAPVHLTVSAAPMRSVDGAVTGILALVADVTDRVRMEEQVLQAERLDAMGRLAGGVAHDFNNLLTVILGRNALMMRLADEHHPMREDLEAIQRAGQRAAALTGQLLAVGRRETGVPVVVDPVHVVKGMQGVLNSVTGEDVTTDFDLSSDCGAVMIDPDQLERVVLNLVMNAVDAMPDGGHLTVALAAAERGEEELPAGAEPGRYVEISVADTGHGMDPATAEHCFEPFFTTKDRSKGTGLGLAAVHGIVTTASGHVVVDSAPEEGTRFTVRLPAVPHPAAVSEGESAEPRPGEGVILLVEDEDELRSLTAGQLATCGYTVHSAAGASEAVELAKELIDDLDLLVTDVVMPQVSGVQLAARLTELRPDLPVLFVSGYAGSDKLEGGRLPPGADLLAKPFSPDELSRRVAEAIDRHQAADQGSKR